jgi:hypothetical protein
MAGAAEVLVRARLQALVETAEQVVFREQVLLQLLFSLAVAVAREETKRLGLPVVPELS